ncbi:MAG: DUF4915 domain-containing protein [Bacillota bacterium]
MNDVWISWSKLDDLSIKNELIFFGASEIAEKTLKKVNKKPIYFIDNNKKKQGTTFHDIKIISPSELKDIDKEFVIIINILAEQEEIENQLKKLGYKAGKDYFYSPKLRNQKIGMDIKKCNQTVLFTSSISPSEEKNRGGGLYEYNFNERRIKKLHSGRFCQMKFDNDKLYVIEHYEGVKVFDKSFNLIDTFEILDWSVPHGLAINSEDAKLYIANTGLDSITVMDINSGKHIKEIKINKNKNDDFIFDKHHINDLHYRDGYLLISMFSFSGMWKSGCYDGGIAKLDLNTEEIVSYPVINKWMPHSVDFIGNEIVFVDSMRGDVYKTNNKILTNIPGFVRGLDYDGKYYYIGQSEHRYFDRLKGLSNNIHVNCGIHIFDEKTKASRFHQLDQYISNIHSIMVKEF